MNIIFIFIFVIAFIIIIIYNYTQKLENLPNSCACVFDLDDTLTCNYANAKNAINACKQNGCVFAINTARTSSYYGDIPLDKLGLEENLFINDIYTGDWNTVNKSFSRESFNKHVANTKKEHLDTISKKYNILKNRIILFDDNINNITVAKENGYSTVHANDTCGLNQNVLSEVNYILTN